MDIKSFTNSSIAMSLLFAATIAVAQPPPAMPPPTPEMEAAMAAFLKAPDTVGTGRFPSLKEEVSSLPNHVIYRPADLSKFGSTKLGVVAWGNGGCAEDGAGTRFHHSEIASHGYLVIANGRILTGPGAPPQAAPAAAPPGGAASGGALPAPRTTASMLRDAIDWALAENMRNGSPYFGRIDSKMVAVSGWSCGGAQALEIAADPRVKTVVIHNSGLFNRGTIPGMEMNKDTLKKLHTSIIYIQGGPTDIAYANGMDDYSRINHVPVMMANLDVGHGGTFFDPNGGRAASVAVSWLDWQLRGDKQAAKRFVGKDCGLCKDSQWKVESKKLE